MRLAKADGLSGEKRIVKLAEDICEMCELAGLTDIEILSACAVIQKAGLEKLGALVIDGSVIEAAKGASL